MDIKFENKEKVFLLDINSQNEQESLSRESAIETKSDESIRKDDWEVDIKTQIKTEASLPELFLQKGEVFTKILAEPSKNKIAIHSNNDEKNIKTETEEGTLVSGFALQNNSESFSEPLVNIKEQSNECENKTEQNNKIEIKEERCWLETISAETSSIYDEIKGEDLAPVNLPRLYTEADSIGTNVESTLCSSEVLQNDESFKDSPKCEEASNFNIEKHVTEPHLVENSILSEEPGYSNDGAKNYNISSCLKQSNLIEQNKKHGQKVSLAGRNSSRTCRKVHKCEICEKDFRSSSDLKKHLLIHEGKKPFKCEICDKDFSQLPHLKSHYMSHEGKKPFKCDICDKDFSRMWRLKTHKLIHQGKKPFKCDICDKDFGELGNLKRHKIIHDGKKPFKCEICDKDFSRVCYLKTHSFIHEGKKPFKCEICDKDFSQLGHLKRHTLIHNGKKPFKCEICDKVFSQMWHLKTHNLVHEGKKPFKCEICNKNFSRIWRLKTHNLIHQGKKPFKCEICEKHFRSMSELKQHNLIHDGKKPQKCEICDKRFTQLGHLKRHYMTHEDKR